MHFDKIFFFAIQQRSEWFISLTPMFGIVSAEQRDKMNVLCDITRVFWTCIHLSLVLVLSINSPLRKNERSLPLNHHGFYYFLSCVNFLILLASKAPSYYPPHMFAIIISLNFLSSIFFLLLPSFNFHPRFIHIYIHILSFLLMLRKISKNDSSSSWYYFKGKMPSSSSSLSTILSLLLHFTFKEIDIKTSSRDLLHQFYISWRNYHLFISE